MESTRPKNTLDDPDVFQIKIDSFLFHYEKHNREENSQTDSSSRRERVTDDTAFNTAAWSWQPLKLLYRAWAFGRRKSAYL